MSFDTLTCVACELKDRLPFDTASFHSRSVRLVNQFAFLACPVGEAMWKIFHSGMHVSQEFIHNQRKINNGEDFPRQFLTDIFNRIRLAKTSSLCWLSLTQPHP